jgi:hypothetical protein
LQRGSRSNLLGCYNMAPSGAIMDLGFSIKECPTFSSSHKQRDYTKYKYNCCWRIMVFSNNFLVIMLVLSTVTLCLAKPRWVWLREEEKNGRNLKNDVLTREIQKNDENPMKEWKKRALPTCNHPNDLTCKGKWRLTCMYDLAIYMYS